MQQTGGHVHELATAHGNFTIARATRTDPAPYDAAFDAAVAHPQQLLVIVRDGDGRPAGTMQLTSDKRRGDAHRFYERLGYVASPEGFKLELGG
ncbi:hypothetical protein [Janibacter indicus]|uniref:hypothetical protein n=1 Tax=Janibacter indicus TaxID=857417 RepID=UPI001F18FB6E|nr:hypothetical protein [Janibacter indicus]